MSALTKGKGNWTNQTEFALSLTFHRHPLTGRLASSWNAAISVSCLSMLKDGTNQPQAYSAYYGTYYSTYYGTYYGSSSCRDPNVFVFHQISSR